MSKKTPRLEIIIVTYNSQFWLKKTLSTLKEQYLDHTQSSVTVTVVDNNSQDDTRAMLGREFRWTERLYLEENYGFSYANNRALEKSTAQYTMLLNSDVESTPDSNLDTLLDWMDEHPECGIITPRLEITTGEIDPACHRGEPTPWAAFCYLSGLESWFPNSTLFSGYHTYYKDLRAVHRIDACSGAALLVRRELLASTGLLDERFFMYAEDLDFCKRTRDEGYEVVYHPEVKLIHHKNKSGIKSTSQKLARKTRSHFYTTMLQYYDKHYAAAYPKPLRTLVKLLIQLHKGA